MLGLVNYGSSDSEQDASDDEVEVSVKTNGVQKLTQNIENDLTITQKFNFPQPSSKRVEIEEEDDDEFLQKKAIPTVPLPPPKKEKVKIFIPKLSDFKDDEDDEDRKFKPTAVKKKNGLIGMLPKPSNSFAPAPKPKPVAIPANVPLKTTAATTSESSTVKSEPTKKVGLIPYSLMSHKPKAPTAEDAKKKKKDDSDSEDEISGSFFSFASNEEDLPKVNDDEVKALVEREKSRMEARKRQHEQPQVADEVEQPTYSHKDVFKPQAQIDDEAMRALLGGNRAKRSKIDDIEIIDINADEVLPDKDEWLRRSLAGETSFIATGKIDEKGPNALSKRKHQISYLSMRAENNVQELEAMWASNRASNKAGRNKYGF